MKNHDLQQTIDLISSTYVFNKENYPKIDDSTQQSKLIFAIQHILLHTQKELGNIAAVSEKYDHTAVRTYNNQMEVEAATVNILINTLKLADILGFSADGLIEAIKKFYENK